MFMNRAQNCFWLIIAVTMTFSSGVMLAPAQLSRPPLTASLQYAPQFVAEIKKVQQAALGSDYAYRQLAHLSDNIGPRLSGSPQAQAAVEYVAAELRKLGLDVKLEKVMVPHWVRGEETAALTDYPSMAPNTIFRRFISDTPPSTWISVLTTVCRNFITDRRWQWAANERLVSLKSACELHSSALRTASL